MNFIDILKSAKRWWHQEHQNMPLLPEARVITGRPYQDAFLHHMLVKHGLEFVLKKTPNGNWVFINHKVVDEQKYIWFIMKWA